MHNVLKVSRRADILFGELALLITGLVRFRCLGAVRHILTIIVVVDVAYLVVVIVVGAVVVVERGRVATTAGTLGSLSIPFCVTSRRIRRRTPKNVIAKDHDGRLVFF